MMRLSSNGKGMYSTATAKNTKTKEIQNIILQEKKKKRTGIININNTSNFIDNNINNKKVENNSKLENKIISNEFEKNEKSEKTDFENILTKTRNTNKNKFSPNLNMYSNLNSNFNFNSIEDSNINMNKKTTVKREIEIGELRERKSFENSFENNINTVEIPNFFDRNTGTIPSLSRPARALGRSATTNENEFLKINSLIIRPTKLSKIEKKLKNKNKKVDILSRRQSNIIYRVQIIQNEIINNIKQRKQLYYYGNKNVQMNSNLSILDKNSITKETKRKISNLLKINETLKKKRYECYLKYQQKMDFSDFGYYKNFFFFVGDFSDAFWNEVRLIIKSGDEKPDYAVTRLARSGVEGKTIYNLL